MSNQESKILIFWPLANNSGKKGEGQQKKKKKSSAPTDNQMDDIFANPFCSSAPTFAPRVLGKKKRKLGYCKNLLSATKPGSGEICFRHQNLFCGQKTWPLQNWLSPTKPGSGKILLSAINLFCGQKTWPLQNWLSPTKPGSGKILLSAINLFCGQKTWPLQNWLSPTKPGSGKILLSAINFFCGQKNLATAKFAPSNKTRKWQKLAFGNKLFLRPEKLGHCKNWLSPTKLGSGKIRFRQQNFFCSQKNLATAKLAFSNKTWPLQNSLLATQNKSLATKTCPLQKRDRGKTSLDETGSLGLKTQTFNAPNVVRDVPV